MKIVREFDGTKVEITLTDVELLNAYMEKKAEYDREFVLNILMAEEYENVPESMIEKIINAGYEDQNLWGGDFDIAVEYVVNNFKTELAPYKRKKVKYRSFNISYVAPDGRHDVTQLDVVDADQTAMYAELFNLFEQFCQDEYLETCRIDFIHEARCEDD